MFDMAGNRLWGQAGVPVSSGSSSTSASVGLPTGNVGQSVWMWDENRTGTHDIFAQKLDSAGTRCWDSTGVWVGTTDTADGYPFSATVDGRGGAIVGWPLHRSGLNWDIYAQHVDSARHLCWNDTGLAVCQDSYRQEWTPANVTDGDGGAILSWHDDRGIYAQRVADGSGIAETPNDEVRATKSGPTVVRGVLMLTELGTRSELPERNSVMTLAALLDVSGRKVLELHPGANDVRALAPGVYFVRQSPGVKRDAPDVAKVIITQ